jgi:RNA polymerase sigma-70 factor (ECF subfamily)
MADPSTLSDAELYELIVSTRAAGKDPTRSRTLEQSESTDRSINRMLGMLCERWRRPAAVVVRRVQQSYRAGSPDDEDELYQEAVRKFIEKGLDQFRGISEFKPGQAANVRTFFLRIVKHATIDAYRRQREVLDRGAVDEEDESNESPREISHAIMLGRRETERKDAGGVYWAAFERLVKEHPNEAAAWDAYHHQDLEDHETCAKQLSITVANSYKRVSRAQAYLRLYLQEQADD